jgi:hypothetical protein
VDSSELLADDGNPEAIADRLFAYQVQEGPEVYKVLNSAATLIQRTIRQAPRGHMYSIIRPDRICTDAEQLVKGASMR